MTAFLKKILLFIFSGLFGLGGIHAQFPDYHLQLFDYSFGIKTGSYTSLTRDEKGFLWISYPRRVQRFDGKHIKEFSFNYDIKYLFADSKGRVWLSTSKDVFCFEDDYHGFVSIKLQYKTASSACAAIFELADSKIYLQSNEGFHLYNELERSFSQAIDVCPSRNDYPLDVFTYKSNTIFFRKGDSLFSYNFQTKKLNGIASSNHFRIFALTESKVLSSKWTNDTYLCDFDAKQESSIKLPALYQTTTPTAFSIRSLVQFKQNRYLLATREGIFQYNYDSNTYRKLNFFQNGYPVNGNDYSSFLYLDKELNVWMLSVPGITRFSLEKQALGLIRVPSVDSRAQGAQNNIRQVVEYTQANLWVATGTGFAKWDIINGKWDVFNARQGAENELSHPSVRGIACDGENIILGPTNKGIWIFNTRTKKYKRPFYSHDSVRTYSEGDFIDDITKLSTGNFLLMGRDALYLLEGRTHKLSIVNSVSAGENNNRAIERADGSIWLITNKAVHLLSRSFKIMASATVSTLDLPLWNGAISKNGSLLLACNGGLHHAVFDGQSISIDTAKKKLSGILLHSVFEDEKGTIWAGSDNGIYRFNPINQEINVFDYADNLQGYAFNTNGPYRYKDGKVFWSGINGLNYVNPESFSDASSQLNVFIQNVQIGYLEDAFCNLNEIGKLPYDKSSMEVELLAPYFNNPDKVKYRYRIEGLDDGWKYLGGNNSFRLSALPAGDYRLVVEASINNINWFAGKNDFRFHVEKPFWLHTWFFVLFGLLGFGSIWLFINNRNNKLRQKQEELETEQAINYISGSIYEQQTTDEILWDVAQNCIGRLHFEDCVIYLIDEDRKVLVQKAAHGAKSPGQLQIAHPIEIPIGKGITGTVAQTGIPEIVNDTSKDSRYIQDGAFRYSEIAVPVKTENAILGVIDCEHSKKGFFTQRHLSVLTTIANLCANKIIKAKAEAEKREAERLLMETKQKMAEAEMQALRAQMNPHFIFNCLNSINRYIVKSDQATASLYLTRFAKLIRLILDNSNSKSIILSNELEALKLYIQMESIRFEKQFTYSVEVSDNINADSISVPPLIIQPYVENAIWHGLLHKESAGKLTVRICCMYNRLLECIIEDNGVGRAKARELKSKSASNKKSLGMQLTEDRLRLLNKQAKVDTTVQIIDLFDSAGAAAGTRVVITIPIDN